MHWSYIVLLLLMIFGAFNLYATITLNAANMKLKEKLIEYESQQGQSDLLRISFTQLQDKNDTLQKDLLATTQAHNLLQRRYEELARSTTADLRARDQTIEDLNRQLEFERQQPEADKAQIRELQLEVATQQDRADTLQKQLLEYQKQTEDGPTVEAWNAVKNDCSLLKEQLAEISRQKVDALLHITELKISLEDQKKENLRQAESFWEQLNQLREDKEAAFSRAVHVTTVYTDTKARLSFLQEHFGQAAKWALEAWDDPNDHTLDGVRTRLTEVAVNDLDQEVMLKEGVEPAVS
jgi:DNA repair exonuclease SbcCD ATPase subunit